MSQKTAPPNTSDAVTGAVAGAGVCGLAAVIGFFGVELQPDAKAARLTALNNQALRRDEWITAKLPCNGRLDDERQVSLVAAMSIVVHLGRGSSKVAEEATGRFVNQSFI